MAGGLSAGGGQFCDGVRNLVFQPHMFFYTLRAWVVGSLRPFTSDISDLLIETKLFSKRSECNWRAKMSEPCRAPRNKSEKVLQQNKNWGSVTLPRGGCKPLNLLPAFPGDNEATKLPTIFYIFHARKMENYGETFLFY